MDIDSISDTIARHDQIIQSHEERITAHGRELDAVTKAVAEIEVKGDYRDKNLARMESKMDSLGGKMDSMTMQMAGIRSAPAEEKAETYDLVKKQVITLLVGAIVGALLLGIGLQV